MPSQGLVEGVGNLRQHGTSGLGQGRLWKDVPILSPKNECELVPAFPQS